jgi:hypothetical protein
MVCGSFKLSPHKHFALMVQALSRGLSLKTKPTTSSRLSCRESRQRLRWMQLCALGQS